VAEVAACDNRDGGRVAQWGWLGFLPNNDGQRWQAVPATDGWTRIQSVLTGSRDLDVSRCAGGTSDNLVVNTRNDASCQEFRFEPVGSVLLVDQDTTSTVLGGRQWRFTSVGGAEYTITDAVTGRLLGAAACHGHGTDELRILGSADRTCQRSTHWTLVPRTDGSWTLTLTGTAITKTVKLVIP
jgi:hypothetical protein